LAHAIGMAQLPEREESLLRPGKTLPQYPALESSIEVDTVIVGGGIAGLSAAYSLKKSGQKVAVIEKDTIGSGTTGHTTGKVTSQHNLTYADIKKRLGDSKARIYAQANQTAVEEIGKIIKREKIDCGWERADNYVYTTQRSRVPEFKQEAKAAAEFGLPASFETRSPLPFKIAGAVRFAAQAHFSGQKYINGLAKVVNGGGSYVFEGTRALRFSDGQPSTVSTPKGKIMAKNIVVATNVPTFPLLARVAYCVSEYPQTSYLIAGRTKTKFTGMYISPDEEHYSLLPVGKGKGQILLIGGQNHIPGLGRAIDRQQKLADYGQEYFGMDSVEYRWHARDYIAYDNIPLIGRLYPWSKHIYVITAFKKWGLSHSYVAASIIQGLIAEGTHPWAETFDSLRLKPFLSIPRTLAKN
jgi:glycine/D-amino acid oxidase-like deaminating enzyme